MLNNYVSLIVLIGFLNAIMYPYVHNFDANAITCSSRYTNDTTNVVENCTLSVSTMFTPEALSAFTLIAENNTVANQGDCCSQCYNLNGSCSYFVVINENNQIKCNFYQAPFNYIAGMCSYAGSSIGIPAV